VRIHTEGRAPILVVEIGVVALLSDRLVHHPVAAHLVSLAVRPAPVPGFHVAVVAYFPDFGATVHDTIPAHRLQAEFAEADVRTLMSGHLALLTVRPTHAVPELRGEKALLRGSVAPHPRRANHPPWTFHAVRFHAACPEAAQDHQGGDQKGSRRFGHPIKHVDSVYKEHPEASTSL
jgi:hypothetical protein